MMWAWTWAGVWVFTSSMVLYLIYRESASRLREWIEHVVPREAPVCAWESDPHARVSVPSDEGSSGGDDAAPR